MRTTRFVLIVLLVAGAVSAQIPAQTVVQAIPISATPAPAANLPVANTTSANPGLNTLQELKAANEEILKRQAASLLQLEEIQKAAEQLKIYSKRG